MSLFDVIRYPIDIPPQEGQLEALPDKIFRYWIDKHTIEWYKISKDNRYNPSNVCYWMRVSMIIRSSEIENDITALRRIIKNWEE